MTCEFCGKHIGAADGLKAYGEDYEYERFMTNVKEDPAHYEIWECDSISYVQIDGRNAVVGCDCNALARYEAFIWQERALIARYYEARLSYESNIQQARLLELARASQASNVVRDVDG